MKITLAHSIYVMKIMLRPLVPSIIMKDKLLKIGHLGHIGCAVILGCYGMEEPCYVPVNALLKKLRMIANHGQRKILS